MTNNSRRRPKDEKEKKSEVFRYIGVASTVGINLVISTFIGFAIGYYLLDKIFNTFPWLTIIFTLLGIGAGFKYLFKVASKMSGDKGDRSDNGNPKKGS
jgi:ATP synthase protein I